MVSISTCSCRHTSHLLLQFAGALIGWGLYLATAVIAQEPAGVATPNANDQELAKLGTSFQIEALPLLQKFCSDCHGAQLAEAEIDFELFKREPKTSLSAYTTLWQRVLEVIDTAQMPPQDSPQLAAAEKTQLLRWINAFLAYEAEKTAGDPGPVVLRRLSNSQYTYTLRDLTGISTLDPAAEFPVDGAAGEGFTNTGNALVMSPALVTKYLDAAKGVAKHMVLLPDGIEFSPDTTPADWTNEKLKSIRDFYSRYTADDSNGGSVNLQGIVFDTNQGGRLPLQKYLQVILDNAAVLERDPKAIAQIAGTEWLSPKYIGLLVDSLKSGDTNVFMAPLHSSWQQAVEGKKFSPAEVEGLVGYIRQWQAALYRFTTVGHIGKVGGPKRWLDTIEPLASRATVRQSLPAANPTGLIELSLLTTSAGDTGEKDFARWENIRLVAAGKRDLPLRDLAVITQALTERRSETLNKIGAYLSAIDSVQQTLAQASPVDSANENTATKNVDIEQVAAKYELDREVLTAWLNYLGISVAGPVKIENHLTNKMLNSSGYEFISGWGAPETPLVLANSSDSHVRIPGNAWPHKVVVHPSPTLEIAVAWLSPVAMSAKITGDVTHAHPECGNGVTWRLELRRQQRRQVLAQGVSHGGNPVPLPELNKLEVKPGDAIVLSIGPRDGNHSCDLTKVDLTIANVNQPEQVWDLGSDVSPDILAGNPHADRQGNSAVWHFFTEALANSGSVGPTLPAGSLLSQWLETADAATKQQLAEQIRALVQGAPPSDTASPDAVLYQQVASLQGPLLGGPLLAGASLDLTSAANGQPAKGSAKQDSLSVKVQTLSDKRPLIFDGVDVVVKAPESIYLQLPAELLSGYEIVADVRLDEKAAGEGSVQAYAMPGSIEPPTSLTAGKATSDSGKGTWTDGLQPASNSNPILVDDNGATREKIIKQLSYFRDLFPPALCYVKIVPVDEVVTLTLFYREDDHLKRLMLDEQQAAHLDRLWDQLHFVSRDALKLVDAFAQLMEYATQDADPSVFEPLREPIMSSAKKFEQQLLDSQPKHVAAVIDFAKRAFRRPLHPDEAMELEAFYAALRREEIPHEEAISLLLSRVLVSPAFLYRTEVPPVGSEPGSVGHFELANRLSYFLWSSLPDHELIDVASTGDIANGPVLVGQAKRMLQDSRGERLAKEFATYWLHIANFDQFDEKSDQFFPTFAPLREPMYQESMMFFTHLFRNDRSILEILSADYTFLNAPLSEHYGFGNVSGNDWQKVQYPADQQRSGVLGQATILSTLAGASRTSPILRGNWVSEVLLGEKLPKPPKGVPPLPDDVAGRGGLSMRELVELHGSNEKCAVCHQRIDPLGFSMENFDAIGRWRTTDEAEKPIDVAVTTIDGQKFSGVNGLRDYLLQHRRDDFVRQFCKKLAGFALGRAIQLSDRGLIDQMMKSLEKNDYRFSSALEPLLLSRQFREIRGRDAIFEEAEK